MMDMCPHPQALWGMGWVCGERRGGHRQHMGRAGRGTGNMVRVQGCRAAAGLDQLQVGAKFAAQRAGPSVGGSVTPPWLPQ